MRTVALALAVMFVATACGGGSSLTDEGLSVAEATTTTKATTTTEPPEWEAICPGSRKRVVLEVNGTAGIVSLTYNNSQGNTEQIGQIRPGFKNDAGSSGIRFCVDPGEFLYISAQNQGDTGSVECTIEVDGRVVSSARSSGGYVIATCDESS